MGGSPHAGYTPEGPEHPEGRRRGPRSPPTLGPAGPCWNRAPKLTACTARSPEDSGQWGRGVCTGLCVFPALGGEGGLADRILPLEGAPRGGPCTQLGFLSKELRTRQ